METQENGVTELIDITVYYLEMLERPVELSVPERTGVEILPVQLPSVEVAFMFTAPVISL